MKYISVVEFAKKMNLSERTYTPLMCFGQIKSRFLNGKTWNSEATMDLSSLNTPHMQRLILQP